MLIKPSQVLRKSQPFTVPWHGVVVDNADPKKISRIKCNIPGLIEGTKDELPWCFRKKGSFLGDVNVPILGTQVMIRFPYKDVYTLSYEPTLDSSLVHETEFDEDYPGTYGLLDEIGNLIKVNRVSKEVTIKHNSGTFILVKADGEINLTGLAKFITSITGDISIDGKAKMDVALAGLFALVAKGNATITGAKVEIGTPSTGVLDNRIKTDKALPVALAVIAPP